MCGGVRGIGGLRVLVGCGGTPGNRKHMPASHYLHCFQIIIQYDITIISTIIFRGCESSWDTGGTWEPQTHANYFSLNLDNDKDNNKTKQILLSQSQCWTPGTVNTCYLADPHSQRHLYPALQRIWVLKGSQKVYQRTNLKCKSLLISKLSHTWQGLDHVIKKNNAHFVSHFQPKIAGQMFWIVSIVLSF